MECRSSDIKIHSPMGKNFKGDGKFGIHSWQAFLSFRDRRHCIVCVIRFVGVRLSLLGKPVSIFHSIRTRHCKRVTD
ncbi:hypothetical protein TNCV_3222711 [Trichonephila clavipes]|uniref:Uncharacterized protein n=1 Tax=Trichonephila clavipes TaxID=2585209 RepID=A0A8X6RIK7_TRICX|nr:hypothetical protein TNCV_3222711 [Trichonephila clavipes]